LDSKYWGRPQIKEFAKSIRKSDVGLAWAFLVPAIRHAIVESKILSIIRGQDRDSIPMEAIMDLSAMLHAEMGTTDL
jgi:hypothetical protein